MAKKISKSEGDAATRGGVKPADLKKAIAEVNRHKKHASENAGLAGKATQNAVELYGLEKKAFTMCARMTNVEPPVRQAQLRALLDYSEKLGFFDEIDMFDDTLVVMEAIIARARAKGDGGPAQDPAVKKMMEEAGAGAAEDNSGRPN